MFHMEHAQFLKNHMPLLAAWVPKYLPPRYHLVSDPTEPFGGPYAHDSSIHSGGVPAFPQAAEIVVTLEKAVGDQEDCIPQPVMRSPDQRPVTTINFVALVPRWEYPSTARDRPLAGVVLDWSHLP